MSTSSSLIPPARTDDWWYCASVDLANNSTTVSATPCLVKGWEVTSVMSAHVCLIKDNTTPIMAIPASSVAGTGVDYLGARWFQTSLVVDPDDVATGTITVYYRPIT